MLIKCRKKKGRCRLEYSMEKSTKIKIEEFSSHFVNEMESILKNGIIINGRKLSIKIRAIICERIHIQKSLTLDTINNNNKLNIDSSPVRKLRSLMIHQNGRPLNFVGIDCILLPWQNRKLCPSRLAEILYRLQIVACPFSQLTQQLWMSAMNINKSQNIHVYVRTIICTKLHKLTWFRSQRKKKCDAGRVKINRFDRLRQKW